jgi:hypothetical protein
VTSDTPHEIIGGASRSLVWTPIEHSSLIKFGCWAKKNISHNEVLRLPITRKKNSTLTTTPTPPAPVIVTLCRKVEKNYDPPHTDSLSQFVTLGFSFVTVCHKSEKNYDHHPLPLSPLSADKCAKNRDLKVHMTQSGHKKLP